MLDIKTEEELLRKVELEEELEEEWLDNLDFHSLEDVPLDDDEEILSSSEDD